MNTLIKPVKRNVISNKISGIKALGADVIVSDMNFEARVTSGGIILVQDDGKDSGIRPRWAKVYAVGPDQTDVTVDQWILISHGRWSRGIDIETPDGKQITLRKVDTKDMLLVSDEPVNDQTLSDKVH